MKSVGERLRRERIDRGIGLATLSSLTRISERYLQAIEAGNIDELPSGFFYRSFVRQYASALGLNTGEMEAELEQVRQAEIPALTSALGQAEFPIRPQHPMISEVNRRSRATKPIWGSVALLVAMLALCSGVYAWWHGLTPGLAASRNIPQAAPAAPNPALAEARAPSSPVENTVAQIESAPPAPAPVSPEVPRSAQKPNPESRPAIPETTSSTPPVTSSGRTYLQVAAVAKSQAELFVEALEKKGFHALYTKAPVPNTYRVLVGPFQDRTALVEARMNLDKVGFKGYEGLVRNHHRIRRLSRRRARSV